MDLIHCITEVARILRGFLWADPEQEEITRRCVDYLCAAHVHGYIGFSEPYTSVNLWDGFNAEYGVLTQEEDEHIRTHRELGGSRMRLCISWCMMELHLAVSRGFIPPPIMS